MSAVEGGDHARPLHALVDEYAAALHHYVEVAVGVRAESKDVDTAANDPRLEVAARAAAFVMGRLDDEFTDRLGLTADVGMAWDDEETEEIENALADLPDDVVGVVESGDVFVLELVVTPGGDTDADLEGAFSVLDEAGLEVVRRIEEAGYHVPSFSAYREAADLGGTDDDRPDDEEDAP